jgi:uncharacterized membrane protein YhaH (DUF805 family)
VVIRNDHPNLGLFSHRVHEADLSPVLALTEFIPPHSKIQSPWLIGQFCLMNRL